MGHLWLENERGLFLGIDFGTNNSVASIYDHETMEVHTIPIDGAYVFPTAIQFDLDAD